MTIVALNYTSSCSICSQVDRNAYERFRLLCTSTKSLSAAVSVEPSRHQQSAVLPLASRVRWLGSLEQESFALSCAEQDLLIAEDCHCYPDEPFN